jgi:hypothetical protein
VGTDVINDAMNFVVVNNGNIPAKFTNITFSDRNLGNDAALRGDLQAVVNNVKVNGTSVAGTVTLPLSGLVAGGNTIDLTSYGITLPVGQTASATITIENTPAASTLDNSVAGEVFQGTAVANYTS